MRRHLLIMVAIVLALPLFVQAASRGRAVAPPSPKTTTFQPNQLEAYLTDDGIAYIRPGLKLTIIGVTNTGPGQKPVVEFTLSDQFDQPLDLSGKLTPGPITAGFVLGQWNPDTRYYHSLTTRTRNGLTTPWLDTGGTYTTLELGHYKYNFATAMPSNLDTAKTLTVGGQAKRTLNDIIGKDYFADNVIKNFRPDGGTPSATWGAMALANSCNKCHDPLQVHGNNRRDIAFCVMCHTNENVDAQGQSFSARVFFHRIHMGANLPSVKAGTPFVQGDDFSTVVWPQDVRNCTTCHDPKAPEADIWYTRPSRAACGSCHDDVNFATGANHPAGAMADDSACAKCHVPASGQEFDASVQGAHVLPTKSKQLKGLKVSIVSVTNVAGGKKPTVVFSVTNGDGTPVDATKLNSFAPILAGPTTNYATSFRESAIATSANPATFDAAKGTTTYTFVNALPAGASGTWTISADAYRNVSLKRGDGQPDTVVREAAMNPITYVAVSGTATPRRVVVQIANCNVCHDALALHGGQRQTTLECVICHNPTSKDGTGRPASAMPNESVSFQRHIHRIHSGENLTQDFTVYGGSANGSNFNDVRFPGDRRDCAKCHAAGTYTLPLQQVGISPVTTLRDYFSPQGPATAACLGCHDNADAAAHAYLNTAWFTSGVPSEACATCHGTGKDWDVQKVHAR